MVRHEELLGRCRLRPGRVGWDRRLTPPLCLAPRRGPGQLFSPHGIVCALRYDHLRGQLHLELFFVVPLLRIEVRSDHPGPFHAVEGPVRSLCTPTRPSTQSLGVSSWDEHGLRRRLLVVGQFPDRDRSGPFRTARSSNALR